MRVLKALLIIIFFLFLIVAIRGQELQEELAVWDLPVEMKKTEEGYKVIDNDSTNFSEVSFNISYLMTSMNFIVKDTDINTNFQIEYIFVDDEGKMWRLQISEKWLNSYLDANSRSVKEDLIRNLILPYKEKEYQQLKDKLKLLK